MKSLCTHGIYYSVDIYNEKGGEGEHCNREQSHGTLLEPASQSLVYERSAFSGL